MRDWLIKLLGGWTEKEFGEIRNFVGLVYSWYREEVKRNKELLGLKEE